VLLLLQGADISVESMIVPFRGENEIWNKKEKEHLAVTQTIVEKISNEESVVVKRCTYRIEVITIRWKL
jgi:NAD-dependent SIR2 family protein deacetylase